MMIVVVFLLGQMQYKSIIERRLNLLLLFCHTLLLFLLMKCLSILEDILNAHSHLILLDRPRSLLLSNRIKHLKKTQPLSFLILNLLHLAIIKYFPIKLAYKSFYFNHKYKYSSIHIISNAVFFVSHLSASSLPDVVD